VTAAEHVVRWSTAGGVVGVAAVAAVASYEHAYALVRAHGEVGCTGRLVPLTVDGLIYASSMVMLDSARRKTPVPALARWLLGLGVPATLAANVAHGLGHGPVGAVVAAWPAVGLVGSYELLMMSSAVVRRHRKARPVARAVRTRFRSGRPRYSPVSWQRIAFLRSARSVLGRTSASPGHSGCESTSLEELRGGLRIPLVSDLRGKTSQPKPRATEARVTA
jgi:hypothetical protein